MSGPLQRVLDQSGVRMTVGRCSCSRAAASAFAVYLSCSCPHPVLVADLARLAVAATACPTSIVRFSAADALAQVRGAVPGGDRPDCARAARRPRVHDRHRAWSPTRCPTPVGPEFRLLYEQQNFGMPLPDALRGFAEARAAARRAVFRDRGADPARSGRQPVGGARQSGVGHPRALQGEAPGARACRRTAGSPAGCSWRCRRSLRSCMLCRSIPEHDAAAGRPIRSASS